MVGSVDGLSLVQLWKVHIELKCILIMYKHLIYKSFNLLKYQRKKIMRMLLLLFGIIDEFVKYLRYYRVKAYEKSNNTNTL